MAALERVLKTCFIILYLLGICVSVENDSSVRLLYTNGEDIVLLDTGTGVTTTISTGNLYVLFLDYHYTAGYIYWSDTNAGTITRKKFPLDGSDEEVIMADGIKPVGISIDMKNDHLYWLDYSIRKLFRSDLDGSNRTEILSDLPTPKAIAMDTVNKWIYMYFYGSNSGLIKKCKFDGSNQQNIITDNIEHPQCIALDLNEQRIYWTDSTLGYITSAKVDGSDVQLITSGLSGPMGIDIHDNEIYFSEWHLGKIYKLSKSPGSSKILIHSDTPYMMSVKVYKGTGECSSYIEQKNEAKRSSGYKIDLTVDTALSDDSLEENWY